MWTFYRSFSIKLVYGKKRGEKLHSVKYKFPIALRLISLHEKNHFSFILARIHNWSQKDLEPNLFLVSIFPSPIFPHNPTEYTIDSGPDALVRPSCSSFPQSSGSFSNSPPFPNEFSSPSSPRSSIHGLLQALFAGTLRTTTKGTFSIVGVSLFLIFSYFFKYMYIFYIYIYIRFV